MDSKEVPQHPDLRLSLPSSSLVNEAMQFSKEHCDEFMHNHAVRSAYWAQILAKGLPDFASQPLDLENVTIICILHDMGFATSSPDALAGLSLDKRFEVDGANIARNFITSHVKAASEWDAARLDRLWTAIALHTTPSIALHTAPEVALAAMAIAADFAGPYWTPGDGRKAPITLEQYKEVTKIFPRGRFNREGAKEIICGLCQRKPGSTYDNFVGGFGRRFGYDGKGQGREEYTKKWEENQAVDALLGGLDALDELDASC